MSDACGCPHPDCDSPGAAFIQGSQGTLRVDCTHTERERAMCCTLPVGHEGEHQFETRTVEGNLLFIIRHLWPTPEDGKPRTWRAIPMITVIPEDEFRAIAQRVGDAYLSSSTTG